MKKICKTIMGIITLSSGLMLTSCDFNFDEVKETVNETLNYTLTVNFLGEKINVKFKTDEEINLNNFIPQIEGYEFKGWYYDSLFSIVVEGSTFLNRDIEVYAKMIKIENTEESSKPNDSLENNNENSSESSTPNDNKNNVTQGENHTNSENGSTGSNENVSSESSNGNSQGENISNSEGNQGGNHTSSENGSIGSNENVSSGSSSSNNQGENVSNSEGNQGENHTNSENGSSGSNENISSGSSSSNNQGENVSNKNPYYQSATTVIKDFSFQKESVYENLSNSASSKTKFFELKENSGFYNLLISYDEQGKDQNNNDFFISTSISFNNNENSKLSVSAVKNNSSLQSQFAEESELTGEFLYKIRYYDYYEEKYVEKTYLKTIKGDLTSAKCTTETAYSKETEITINVNEESFKASFAFSIKEVGDVYNSSRFNLQGQGSGVINGCGSISINEDNFLLSQYSEIEGTTNEGWQLYNTSCENKTVCEEINGTSAIEIEQK